MFASIQQHKLKKNINVLINGFVFVVLFIGLFSSISINAKENLSANEIEVLIEETHKVKRNGTGELGQNLATLRENKLLLNQSQLEEFMYLNAYQASMLGDLNQSIKLHKRLDHSNNIQNRIRSFSSQLNMHLLQNNFRECETLIDKLLVEVELLDDNAKKVGVFEMIGYYYNHINEYQLALNYLSLVDQSVLSDENMCLVGFHESISKLGLGHYRPNDPEVIKQIQFCKKINQLIIANSLTLENARYLTKNGRYQESLDSLYLASEDFNLATYSAHNFDFNSQLMKNHLELDQVEKATEYANLVIKEIPNNKKSKWGLESFKILALLAERQHNYSEALAHLKSYKNAQSADFDLKKKKAIARAQVSHQVNEHNRRLNTLKEQNQEERARVDHLTQENNDLLDILYLDKIIIAILFVSVCILYFIVFGLRARKQGIINQNNIDPLTNTFSRRYYIDLLASKIYKAKFANQQLTLITFNFDNFKRINTHYGYKHGDYILKQTAKIFLELAPEDAILSRVGSDEFSIIISNCISDNAMILCERIKEMIRQVVSEDKQIQYLITVSFGITDTRSSKHIPKGILSDSNKAIKKAKDLGKNTIVTFDSSMSVRRKRYSSPKLKYVYKS